MPDIWHENGFAKTQKNGESLRIHLVTLLLVSCRLYKGSTLNTPIAIGLHFHHSLFWHYDMTSVDHEGYEAGLESNTALVGINYSDQPLFSKFIDSQHVTNAL